MKIGDLVRHPSEGWWGVIVGILTDPNLRSLWFEVYCSETDTIRGSWDYQVEYL